MTFNIQTILAFNKILNDSNAANILSKQNIALIPMIKSIVRMFGEASRRTPSYSQQILVVSSTCINALCKQLDGVYDASQFAVSGGRMLSDSDRLDISRWV